MGRPLFEQSTVWLRGLIEAMDEVASSSANPSAADRKALANRLKLPAMLPPLGVPNAGPASSVRRVRAFCVRLIVAAPDADAVTPLRWDIDKLREDVDKLMEGKTT